MLLAEVAAASADIASASARRAKTDRLAALLSRAAADGGAHLVAVTGSWLSGYLPQRQIGVGRAALRSLPPPASTPTLTVAGVDARFTRIGAVAGKGARTVRAELVRDLFEAASGTEQTFLRRLLNGELRQGALAGVMADAETIALRPDGRPHRFQVTAARFGRRQPGDLGPLSVFFFDLLHLDGRDLLDLPTRDRLAALDTLVPRAQRVDRLVTADPDAAQQFLDRTLASGHEGVMAKSPSASYEAGRRDSGRLEVKPVHTLDLVVLAVEWGSGRRTGTLSNIHLGARDPATDGFVMLGKTFKGMTDAMPHWPAMNSSAAGIGSGGPVSRRGGG